MLSNLVLPRTWWGQFFFIIGISWCSLGVFGFYRIFYIMVVKFWNYFLKDIITYFDDTKLSYYAEGHAIWAIIYLAPGPFILRFITSFF